MRRRGIETRKEEELEVEGVREGERMRLVWHIIFTRPFHHGKGEKERGG